MHTHADGDRVILEVSNSGPRIADADLDRLTEPFRRAGRQRTGDGSGLGLSIVRAIVTAHDGDLGLRPLRGGGLAVRVSLPAAPAGCGTGARTGGSGTVPTPGVSAGATPSAGATQPATGATHGHSTHTAVA